MTMNQLGSLFEQLPIMPRPRMPYEDDHPPQGQARHLITIVLKGEPVPKGRPRARIMKINGKFVPNLYTPKETEKYEDDLKIATRNAINAQRGEAYNLTPITSQPVFLKICAYMAIPKSWSKSRRAAALRGEIMPTVMPDWDNFGKIASDALNSIIYRDDALVTDATVSKRYSAEPRMEIEVYI